MFVNVHFVTTASKAAIEHIWSINLRNRAHRLHAPDISIPRSAGRLNAAFWGLHDLGTEHWEIDWGWRAIRRHRASGRRALAFGKKPNRILTR
jgi:hypothetical protein